MCTQRNTNNSKCDILGPSERVRHITAGVLQKRISPIWLLCISGLAVGLAVPQLSKGSGAGFILTNKCPPSPQEENPTSFPPAAAFDVCLFNDIIGSQSSVLGGVLVQRRVVLVVSCHKLWWKLSDCLSEYNATDSVFRL